MSPQRIQLRRTNGWRMPAGTKSVARPTRYGNPFVVVALGPRQWRADGPGTRYALRTTRAEATADAVHLFRRHCRPDSRHFCAIDPADLDALSGFDLACWCPLGPGQPCHAAVLLHWANR